MYWRRRHQHQLRSRRYDDALDRLLILVTAAVPRSILDTAFTLLLGRFTQSVAYVSVPGTRRIFTRRSKKLLQRNVKRATNLFKSC
jgi:hypothetical protein